MSNLCNLCPHQCNIDRDIKTSFCHSTNEMRICRIAPHYYEEPPISGTQGSGTIFFSGCSMDCEFCQNYEISKSSVGQIYTPSDFSKEIINLEKQGVHNINFVTPTHFSHKIRETLDIYRPSIPIVYNTSGYEIPNVIKEMNQYVDIYLTDLKYMNNELANKFSKTKDYLNYCLESLDVMIENKPLIINQDGIMQQGVIIRHLVLPGFLDNTISFIEYFKEKYEGKALISIMSQFVPMYKSSINRTLKPLEYKIIINKLIELHLEDSCYIQELSSANSEYTPDFNK